MEKLTLRKAFLARAIPGVLALLLNSAYVVVDGLFVARLIGRDALAAVTVGVPVMEVLIALSMLVSVGSGVLISRHQGRGEHAKARDIFNVAFRAMLVFSLVVGAIGLLLHRQIGGWIGGTPEIMPMVDTYLAFLFGLSPFLMFSFGLGTWARNDGKPKLALLAMGIGALTNIVLDYVFIAWFDWGVGGAAFATGLGPVVSCAVLLPHFLKGKGTLFFEKVKVTLADMKAILFSGIPSFFMEFSLGLTTMCMNIAVSHHFGSLGLAAYGVVGYVALIGLTIYLGMAEGIQPLFSFYHGRGDTPAVRYLLRLSQLVCIVSGVLFYGLQLVGAKVPATIFGGTDTSLVDLSVYAMHLYFPALFASGMNIQYASCLQSLGYWKPSAIISMLRALVLLAAMLICLPLLFGSNSIWYAVPVTEMLTLPIAFVLCRNAIRRESALPVAPYITAAAEH